MVEPLELILDLLDRRLGRLSLLLEFLGLLLEDSCQARRGDRADTARSRRTSPLLTPAVPTTTIGSLGHPFHARASLFLF
jgi:hypothetical protein